MTFDFDDFLHVADINAQSTGYSGNDYSAEIRNQVGLAFLLRGIGKNHTEQMAERVVACVNYCRFVPFEDLKSHKHSWKPLLTGDDKGLETAIKMMQDELLRRNSEREVKRKTELIESFLSEKKLTNRDLHQFLVSKAVL